MFFSSVNAYTLGCELNDRSIKLVQIKRGGFTPQIISVAHTLLKEGIVENGKILQLDALIKSLGSAISKIRGKKLLTNEVTFSLPNSQTFVKTIAIKRNHEETIEKQIHNEIDKHFPLDPAESYFDYQILTDTGDTIEVIISAVGSDIANPYIELAKHMNWHLVALELESVATARALLGKDLAENALIIDIGHAHSSLVIISNNTVQFTLSLPVSGRSINETISHKLKLRIDQAEKAKIKCGLDEKKCKGALRIVLDSILDDLAFKIEDAFSYYEEHSSHSASEIKKVIVTGGGSQLINIEKVLSTKLKRDVIKNHEIRHVKPIKNKRLAETIHGNLNVYTTVIGLALRSVYSKII
jgi:type IV pilus assembly protein PilM